MFKNVVSRKHKMKDDFKWNVDNFKLQDKYSEIVILYYFDLFAYSYIDYKTWTAIEQDNCKHQDIWTIDTCVRLNSMTHIQIILLCGQNVY